MCVCVCMHVCVTVHMYVCVSIYVGVCMYLCVCVLVCTRQGQGVGSVPLYFTAYSYDMDHDHVLALPCLDLVYV